MRKKNVLRLLVCLLIIFSLAIARYGKILGYDLKMDAAADAKAGGTRQAVAWRVLKNGATIVNTTSLGNDIIGYAGQVPLEITIQDGIVQKVQVLDNEETPRFMARAAALLSEWQGKSLDEALALQVDAVSGATYTSQALIGNMQLGLRYAQAKLQAAPSLAAMQGEGLSSFLSLKNILGLLVVLMAAILPLFVKNRIYRFCQLALNVGVLGLWCGNCLSYASLLGYAAHGLQVLTMAVPLVMLFTALVYPLLGKPAYYCAHVCPFGSLQQLAGQCLKFKLRLSPKAVKWLNIFRQALWVVLMLCIWTGVWADWTDYEPFSAFVFQSASWVVTALALVFVVLSLIIPRPYCRFVCPLGTLLKLK